MLGWTIFSHSVRMVFNNMQQALQIGLVPSVAAAVFSTTVLHFTGADAVTLNASDLTAAPESAILVLGTALASFFVTIWIFVAWHRFVLLEEYPVGWVPAFRVDRFFEYLGYTLLLFGVLFVAAICFAVPVVLIGVILSVIPGLGLIVQVVPLLVLVLVYVAFLRFSPVLPAAAIGVPLGLGAAAKATAGTNGMLILLAAILLIVQVGLAGILILALQVLPILGIASQTIIGLVMSLVNVSVLTAMYGVFVEKRELT